MVRLVDLSHPWGMDTPSWPGYPYPMVRYLRRTFDTGFTSQIIETPLHVGTHMDAPLHFIPGGKDMASVPLDRLYGPGVIVDVSDQVGELDIIEPEHITSKIDVQEGDILIIHTGWHHYYTYGTEPDEAKYFYRHPGPRKEFADWAVKMKLRWIGVDCGSADHPMNLPLRHMKPDIAREFEAKIGKALEEFFPSKEYAPMHRIFKHDIVHVENIGGDIDQVLNKRLMVGAFPWKFVGGEASICRVVAFLEE